MLTFFIVIAVGVPLIFAVHSCNGLFLDGLFLDAVPESSWPPKPWGYCADFSLYPS